MVTPTAAAAHVPGRRRCRDRARAQPWRPVGIAALLLACVAFAPAWAQAPTPTDRPDLSPRALEPEELDPVTVARIGLRYQIDGPALEVLAASRAPALILGVALQGQTVFLEAYGSRTPGGDPAGLDDPLWLASLTKPLTALAVLRLAARGEVDLDGDAAAYLPPGALGPPADPGDRAVTVRDLLTHTAGLDHRFLGLAVGPGEPLPTSWAEAAAGLPPRTFAPGSRLSYCNACYLALGAIVAGATGLDDDAAYRREVFDPLGMTRASVAVGIDDAYEAATLPPHAHGPRGLEPVTMPVLREVGAGRARASAHDVMRLLEALTDPQTPAALAGGVREALLGGATRVHPALPGWTAGLAESVVLGHGVVRHEGDLPGVQAALAVVPDAHLAVFVYLNAEPTPDADAVPLASNGVRDARSALIDVVVATLLGDARGPDALEGWPAIAASTAAPPTGTYRVDRYAHRGPERAFGPALAPIRLSGGPDALRLDVPLGQVAALTFERAADGVWRSRLDGAPLVATRDAAGSPVLLTHLGATLTLEPVPWWERPGLLAATWAAALVAAIVVLVSWPLGAALRRRRLEPRDWDRSALGALGRSLRRTRALTRSAALLVVGLGAVQAWLVWSAVTRFDAPIDAVLPWLHLAAALLAVVLSVAAAHALAGLARFPSARWRWLWQTAVTLAFAAVWAQGWVWQLWSPATVIARWFG